MPRSTKPYRVKEEERALIEYIRSIGREQFTHQLMDLKQEIKRGHPTYKTLSDVITILSAPVHSTLEDLYAHQFMSFEQMEEIRKHLDSEAVIIISGGAGSGKITLVSALANSITKSNPESGIMVMEKSNELIVNKNIPAGESTPELRVQYNTISVEVMESIANKKVQKPVIVMGDLRGTDEVLMIETAMEMGNKIIATVDEFEGNVKDYLANFTKEDKLRKRFRETFDKYHFVVITISFENKIRKVEKIESY
ncbi:ATPase, T2SS/T4P/T4SS family [Paenibacillus taichungensis]